MAKRYARSAQRTELTAATSVAEILSLSCQAPEVLVQRDIEVIAGAGGVGGLDVLGHRQVSQVIEVLVAGAS